MPLSNERRGEVLEALSETIREAADGFVIQPYVLERIADAIAREPERMAELFSHFAPETSGMATIRESAAPREPRFTSEDDEPGRVVNMTRAATKDSRQTPTRSNPLLDAERRRVHDKSLRDARKKVEDGQTFADKINAEFGEGLGEDDAPKDEGSVLSGNQFPTEPEASSPSGGGESKSHNSESLNPSGATASSPPSNDPGKPDGKKGGDKPSKK